MRPDTALAVLTIDLAAIVANWRLLRLKRTSRATGAVVKADGYGLGARPVAAALAVAGCCLLYTSHWRWRFTANRDTIASIYDERFCRMFEFYLSASELAFRRGGNMVFQIQLAAKQDAVPLTRDYMYAGAGRIGVSSPVSS